MSYPKNPRNPKNPTSKLKSRAGDEEKEGRERRIIFACKRRKKVSGLNPDVMDEENLAQWFNPQKKEGVSGLNPDVMDEEDERWFNPQKKEGGGRI